MDKRNIYYLCFFLPQNFSSFSLSSDFFSRIFLRDFSFFFSQCTKRRNTFFIWTIYIPIIVSYFQRLLLEFQTLLFTLILNASFLNNIFLLRLKMHIHIQYRFHVIYFESLLNFHTLLYTNISGWKTFLSTSLWYSLFQAKDINTLYLLYPHEYCIWEIMKSN